MSCQFYNAYFSIIKNGNYAYAYNGKKGKIYVYFIFKNIHICNLFVFYENSKLVMDTPL